MFVFNKAAEGQISTHQFEITGSTYAPEGEVLAFMLLRVDICNCVVFDHTLYMKHLCGCNLLMQLLWCVILARSMGYHLLLWDS